MSDYKEPEFNRQKSKERCLKFRKRILDISQTVGALHIASAYSCIEVVESIYFSLMRRNSKGDSPDTFIMSKGHGCLAQYVALEELGVFKENELSRYCKVDGILGTHPDYGNPGIEASTGSLGHGLGVAVGMALGDKILKATRNIFVVLSDGELQEGSTWEALLIAPSRGIKNIIAIVDMNDFQSLGRTSALHPNMYPVVDKLRAFGWESHEVDGHNAESIFNTVKNRKADRPLAIVAKTVKGKGISFMEHVPIWHYRSPSADEYKKALRELSGPANEKSV